MVDSLWWLAGDGQLDGAGLVKRLSAVQMAWHGFASWCGNVGMWIGKWTGWLFAKPRGCWVTVSWDIVPPKDSDSAALKDPDCWTMRLSVVNQSRYPVVVVDAGWLVFTPGREAVEIPLLGSATVEGGRYEVAAKSQVYLAVDGGTAWGQMSPEFAEALGLDGGTFDPRFDWAAYVRLDSGRLFRSYAKW